MNKFVFSGLAGGLAGAMLAFGGTPAAATTLSAPALAAPGETSMVHKVQSYRPHLHGPRYSYRRPGYPYYHGGYYYATPWWGSPGVGFGITLPGVTLGLGAGQQSAHVQWCMDRYKTYDPATDTYVPRVGERARCDSPYN